MASTLPKEMYIVCFASPSERFVSETQMHQSRLPIASSSRFHRLPKGLATPKSSRCHSHLLLLRNNLMNNAEESTNEFITLQFIQPPNLPGLATRSPRTKTLTCSASGSFRPGSQHDMVSREYLIQYYRWLAQRKAESLRQLEEMHLEEGRAVELSEMMESSIHVLESSSSSNPPPLQLVRVDKELENALVTTTPSWLKRWEVPWGAKEISLGMVSWVFSFGVSGLLVQFAAHQTGWHPWVDGGDGIALYLLANESVRTILGLCIVYLVIKPFTPLSSDFFHFGVDRPFSLNSGWLLWSAVGFSCASAAVQLSTIAMTSFSGHVPTRAAGDALVEVLPIIAFSPMSTLTLVTVTGICAPILEETIFRGFLMTSLTKWMPTPIAAFLSACAFAAAHLSPDQFPKLAALGMVLGISYAKTRNLLTPIIIHSIWNSGIILALTFFRLGGQNISKFL